jgi:hypothetical protein
MFCFLDSSDNVVANPITSLFLLETNKLYKVVPSTKQCMFEEHIGCDMMCVLLLLLVSAHIVSPLVDTEHMYKQGCFLHCETAT